MSLRLATIAGLLCVCSPLLFGQQAQSSSSQAQQTPQGVILGQVVDGTTGKPVPNATVTLATFVSSGLPVLPVGGGRGPLPNGPMRALSNGEGRFVFRPVGKGLFMITATTYGYVAAMVGQARPEGPSREIALDDSGATVQVTLKMWRFASISGTVFEDNGDPAIGATVRAYRVQWVAGRRTLWPTSQIATDDRGMYRLSSLSAGEYIVAAPFSVTNIPTSTVDAYQDAITKSTGFDVSAELQLFAPPFTNGLRLGDQQLTQLYANRVPAVRPTSGGRFLSFQTAYPGSASSLSQAASLTLAPGEERGSIDIHLRLVPTVRVSGVVRTANGPVRNINVRLAPADAADQSIDTSLESALTQTDPEGRFTFIAVPSGQYVLKVQSIPATRDWDGFPMFPDPVLWASQPVVVGDSDVANVAVDVRFGAFVRGRVEFESTVTPRPSPEQIAKLSVQLVPLGRIGPMTGFPVFANEDGVFVTPNYAPGRYILMMTSPWPSWTLSSATVGGREVSLESLELGAEDIKDLIVTFVDQTTEVSGAVKDGGRPVADASVVVFPSDTQAWINGGMSSRRARVARLSAAGAFTIRDLPPGDYVAMAVSPDVLVDLQDPQWIAKMQGLGVRLSLRATEKKRLDLELTRGR